MPSPQPASSQPDIRRHRLDGLFAPRSIALVGATEKSAWSGLLTRNYSEFEFDGELFAVNPAGADVFGVPGFESLAAIGRSVDLAFIMVPQSAVLSVIEEAAATNIRNAVVLTSGYAEIGEEGVARQRALVARARELGINMWGPNSRGFNNMAERLPASQMQMMRPLLEPRVAIIAQSGSTAATLSNYAHSQNIGVSFLAAMGNEAAITIADVVDWLVEQEHTKVIAIFAESIKDPAAFARAAVKAHAAGKPVVILKIGRSELASAVAQAHTGSLIGNDAVFDAVCESLGVIRVDSAEDLVDVAGLLASTGRLAPGGFGFLSISGGACTLVADAGEQAGVFMPPFEASITDRLREVVPDYASTLNPLDVTGAAINKPELFADILSCLADAGNISLVGIGVAIPTRENTGVPALLDAVGRGVSALGKPAVMVKTCADAFNDVSRAAMTRYGLPHGITGISSLLRIVERAQWWSGRAPLKHQPLLLGRAPGRPADAPTGEQGALDFLAAHGVPVVQRTVARSSVQAAEAAAAIAGPLALKIVSPDIAHKTEVGGVRLNVPAAEAGAAYDAMIATVSSACPGAAIEGIVLSPMRDVGLELIVGVTNDPAWGPTITIGLGGVLVEVLADAVVTTLPIDRAGVRAALDRLRGARLLKGFRGRAPVDIDRLCDVIVAIGQAAIALGPDLGSLEINPLAASGDRIEALDALVLWQEADAT